MCITAASVERGNLSLKENNHDRTVITNPSAHGVSAETVIVTHTKIEGRASPVPVGFLVSSVVSARCILEAYPLFADSTLVRY